MEQRLLAVVRARALRRAACCCATATPCTRPRSRSGCWPARGHAELVLALDDAKPLGEEEMKVHAQRRRAAATRINKALDPAEARGRVHRADADRAGGRRAARRGAARRPGERDPQLYYEDGFQEYADRGGRVGVAPIGGLEWVEVDDQRDLAKRAGGRVPLLTPHGRGAAGHRHRPRRGRRARAAARRPPHLQRRPRRRSRSGPGRARRSPRCCARSSPTPTSGWSRAARVEAATELRGRLRAGFFDARGRASAAGKTLDTAKHAAALSGLPMVAVATSLAHDGIASPVVVAGGGRAQGLASACRCRSRSSSTSTTCARSEPAMRRSGIGDVDLATSSRDRRLAAGRARARRAGRRRGGHVRAHRRDVGPAPRGRDRRRRLPDRAGRGARALRPGDGDRRLARARARGGDHEILHAIDHLFPGTAQPRRAGRRRQPVHILAAGRRQDGARHRRLPDAPRAAPHARRPRPRRATSSPRRSSHAPATRPDRYTILEHLDLSEEEVAGPRPRVRRGLRSLSCARSRSRRASSSATAGEHWAGKLYVRRYSTYLTRLVLPTRVTPERA